MKFMLLALALWFGSLTPAFADDRFNLALVPNVSDKPGGSTNYGIDYRAFKTRNDALSLNAGIIGADACHKAADSVGQNACVFRPQFEIAAEIKMPSGAKFLRNAGFSIGARPFDKIDLPPNRNTHTLQGQVNTQLFYQLEFNI